MMNCSRKYNRSGKEMTTPAYRESLMVSINASPGWNALIILRAPRPVPSASTAPLEYRASARSLTAVEGLPSLMKTCFLHVKLRALRQRLRAAKNQGSLRQICLGRGNLAEKQCPLGSSQARHGRCHFLGLTPGIQTNPCRKMGFFKHIPHLVDGTPQDVHQIGRKPGAQNCADGQAQSHPQQHGPQVVQMLQKGLFLIFPFNLPLLPQTEYVF